ncbi:lysophospholipid acyltransferase NDAI_0K02680 [Naumovozyma dairenensis CBS 421]|uniref:Uncharacterized protein n=1 Tax=Naumovozyma dairenensis (strain ATCC 10597 / BCRC 20456 / CBS 421 / NBRC 0211 / NRRL Y-12639) TaxID=1071378 RepID=G0WI48_NAUDC|nr:hypothetical protein NDAI_0K02680 [Naumovozyma dairenensis CBS 421]CCD27459.1 hypothetical protein NDAI_0K02680 [Naumovozyma dairenensis CBS 421]
MHNPVDQLLINVSETYGIDNFTLRYALCLLGSFPANAILKRIPDEKQKSKCLYIIFISMFYLFGILNLSSGFRTLFISSMFTFLITRFYHSKFMPHLNFIFIMGHLAMNHIHAQFYNGSTNTTIDITSSQMVLAMKLISFAWSYHDGTHLSKEDFDELTEYQKDHSIKSHPSILEFLAYSFFYPTLLTGPSFDYSDFINWLNCEMFHDLPEFKKPKQYRLRNFNFKRSIPKNGKLALWKVIQGLIWMFLNAMGLKYFPVNFVIDKSNFTSKSFLYKIHYMFLLGLIARFKYYAAWTISEASCIVCGLGYNGYEPKTKKIKWNRVQNVDIWNVEMAENTRQCLEGWNMSTNRWLKYSIYLRVVKKGSKPGFRATMFTFLTSAFWHGTRPGYYLTFATGALYQTCGKFFRRNLRPIFLKKDGVTPGPYKWIYDYLGMWIIKVTFGYLVQPFLLLDLRQSLKAWSSVYFYGHIGIAISFFLFRGPFAKNVINFCKSKQPKEMEIIRQKALEKEIAQTSTSLGDILKDKIKYEQENEAATKADEMNMTQGIPSLEPEEWENPKKEWLIFIQDYNEWRDTNGLEVEEENLSKAFQNFKQELKENASELGRRKMSFSGYSPKPISKKE